MTSQGFPEHLLWALQGRNSSPVVLHYPNPLFVAPGANQTPLLASWWVA